MSGQIKTVKQILEADLCLGCAACTYVVPEKITMEISGEGYLRPQVKSALSAEDHGRVVKVCPGINVVYQPRDARYHELWGPLVSAGVGWSTDDGLRHKASSGGAISAIAAYLIKDGNVDAILHIGVSASDPLRNEFRISRTPEEITANAGSRYAPGTPLEGLTEAVKQFSRIGLIGKPCDIVAIRKIAALDPDLSSRIAFCMSFMCAGVPSLKGTHAVLRELQVAPEDVVAFRYRGNGWPGHATATTRQGVSRSMTYEASWGRILNKHLQFRCKICVDGTGEFADLTCADAWYGTADGYPDFEEHQGRSLILSRNAAGEALIRDAVAAGFLHVEPLAEVEIERMQPYQASRKRMLLSRIAALRLFGRSAPIYDLGLLWQLARKGGIKNNLRSFVGMTKRLLPEGGK
jgi:coenzyme F420 hydrogenase subunit beta